MGEPSHFARPPGKRRARRAQKEVTSTLSDGLFLVLSAFSAIFGILTLVAQLTEPGLGIIGFILFCVFVMPPSLGGGAAWLISAARKPSDPLSPFLRWGGAAMLALPWAVVLIFAVWRHAW